MSRNNAYWDGSVHITYDDVELDCDVLARGTYYYSPGTMYRRNGDPGDPPEEDIDVASLELEDVYIDGENIMHWLKDDVIKEIKDLCIEAIEEGQLSAEDFEDE